jgi:aryl-alcohol dehydrogenase-like predicted oxidoreductase
MIYRALGRTGLRISAIAFGAGPVSGLMTGTDTDAQRAAVTRAIEAGINWFDTAPGYGQGKSEENLGRVLADLGAGEVHVATKFRLTDDAFANVGDFVRRSVEESLKRLRLSRVTLLQLHNGITRSRGDEPASITPLDVLGPVSDAFERVRREGLVDHLGLTGTGDPTALREVIHSGHFETVQVPFNILNPSAGLACETPGEVNYGNIIADCAAKGMGVFAIRVFAGGALVGQPPSAHTLKTPYFPLELYERDQSRAQRLHEKLGDRLPPAELAVRFALTCSGVSSAIVGFGSAQHVEEIAGFRLDAPSTELEPFLP